MPYLIALHRFAPKSILVKIKSWINPLSPLFTLIFLSFQLFYSSQFLYSINLEDFDSDFIIESRRLEIPGHPHAFNPSITRWRGSLVMSFREISSDRPPPPSTLHSSADSIIGIVWLDDDFHPKTPAQILQFTPDDLHSQTYSRLEDARLVTVGEKLYLVNSDNTDPVVTEGGFRMHVAELDFDGENFLMTQLDRLLEFPGEDSRRREKNWTPFDYNGNMLLAYSLTPHHILRPYPGTSTCETVANTSCTHYWELGEIRGGTPALKISDTEYLAFFHSSMEIPTLHSNYKESLHYFMGAYLFSAHPPFAITHISTDPIIGKQFYQGKVYKPYWKPVQVVFPCGYIFDDSYIWISYGRQDHEIWICKLDKNAFLRNLRSEPVKK